MRLLKFGDAFAESVAVLDLVVQAAGEAFNLAFNHVEVDDPLS